MSAPRHCLACGSPFHPLLHVPNQHYCSAKPCQRERRRRWQQERLRSDADYRENQARAQGGWRDRHPDYWRTYRASHPGYIERNRMMQRARNARRTSSSIANMNASIPPLPIASGFYILQPIENGDVAKMNACTVHIAVLSEPRRHSSLIAKR